MNVLRTENLKKYYGNGDNLVRALDGIDLDVERGEFVAVVGTSGSGKFKLKRRRPVRIPQEEDWICISKL